MKGRIRRAMVVAGVVAVVAFAGFLAYRAHGELEGLISGSDDHPAAAAPAQLRQAAAGAGNAHAGTIVSGKPKVNIGLSKGESAETGE